MIGWLHLLLNGIAVRFKSRTRLEAEVLILRHQVNVLRRTMGRRPRLTAWDRLVFVALSCPQVLDAVAIISPDTVIRWHRRGLKAFWRWKSRSRGGRPAIPKEIRDLIREMSQANWLWGAPRIHGELLKLGIEIAESTVAKSMGQTPQTTWPELGDFPAQPCSGDCRHGSIRRAHDRLQAALLSGVSRSRPEGTRSPRRDGTSNGRMGCSADDRSIPVGHSAKIPGARSRRRLWPRREATTARVGNPRSTNCAAVALAEL